MAEIFIPNPDNLPEVNHKDEDKLNYQVENLEWCTGRYNKQYTRTRSPHKVVTWFNCGGRKLSSEQVLDIRRIGRAVSQRELADLYGVSRQTISKVLNGETFKGLVEISRHKDDEGKV